MAENINNQVKLDQPVSVRRLNAIPLDDSFVFESLTAAQEYISLNDTTAYEGHIIYVLATEDDRGTYYYVAKQGDAFELRPIMNTLDITKIEGDPTNWRSSDHDPHTINAHVTIAHSLDLDIPGKIDNEQLINGELVVTDIVENNDVVGQQLRRIESGHSDILTPVWTNDNDAIFPNNIKAVNLNLGDEQLTEEKLEQLNNMNIYEIHEFKVVVYDSSDSVAETLSFNFRNTDQSWEEWCLANTSTGFRCIDVDNKTYIRYKNSFLVYGDSDSADPLDVSESPNIIDDATYYCKPAVALNPITNIRFNDKYQNTDADGNMVEINNCLQWKNPSTDSLTGSIGSIRIVYRMDRFPENEDDIMYELVVDDQGNKSYVQADNTKTGIITLNTALDLIPDTVVYISLDEITIDNSTYLSNLLSKNIPYYFYITPGTTNGFYTISDRQRVLVTLKESEEPVAASQELKVENTANTSNTALETLLGV